MRPLGSLKSIRETMEKHGLYAKKQFGQNFLFDANVLSNIADAAKLTANSAAVEVGPGLGGLTEALAKRAGAVLAFEIDKDLVPILKDHFAPEPKVIVLERDILSVDLDTDIARHLPGFQDIALVANLPYYITTPILMKVLETSRLVKRMIVMMQLEVAQRIAGKPGTKDYNALSIVIQYRAHVKQLFKVPRTVFLPAPNVDSAVVEIVMKETRPLPLDKESAFFRFAHDAFRQRRKTLSNNLLIEPTTLTRSQIEETLLGMGLVKDVRGEQLSVEQFIELFLRLGH
jgi:16S rRNA (adenine1518-N6/adenine1519-N6)-dimethyltransferase